jgi:protocatechuate 3,4-dioxygenase beta subunit
MSRCPPDSAPGAHEQGLARDLPRLRLLDRRSALGVLGAAGGAMMLATRGDAGLAAASESCTAYARETDGPYPGDGTNQAPGATSNVLAIEAFRRRDIPPSLIGSDTVAPGVPVELTLTLVHAAAGCRPLAGHVLYLWHNDAAGRYSLYDLPEESYLRGVQVADDAGQVRFTTIFPGCYGGRYPHMHFQVFSGLEEASSGRQALLTSQLALPAADCASVYADGRTYGGSLGNLERTSLTRDFIFRDNPPAQMGAMTLALNGSPDAGFGASATIGIMREDVQR